MPILTLPLAMIALAALPALASIYWLRNRYRRHEVSSLLLWGGQREAREGGSRLNRMQVPLLLLLELLAILLLACAAAGPRVLASAERRQVVVILDGSYSMQAEHGPRKLALEALRKELDTGGRYSAQLILADAEPRVLGPPTTRADATLQQAEAWTHNAPTADLLAAITLAREIGGPRARVLILTDQPAPEGLDAGRLQWWSFGQAQPNLAITSAVRSHADGRERVMIEVTNLGDASTQTTLTLTGGDTRDLTLPADSTQRLWLELNASDQPFVAQLPDDALALDNKVTLLPQPRPTLRVGIAIDNEALRDAAARFIDLTDNTRRVTDNEQLLITDSPTAAPADDSAWVLRFRVEPAEQVVAYVGPFVVDRAHPLALGASYEGVIWSAGQDDSLPGRPIVAAGNVSLITEAPRKDGRVIRVRLRPDQSTLLQSADFPVLMWNLIDWQLDSQPGLRESNYRLGTTASLSVERTVDQVTVSINDADDQTLAVPADRVDIPIDRVGLAQIQAGDDTYTFSANAMSLEESDLRDSATARAGSWLDETAVREEYRSIAWLLLIVTLLALALHTALISRSGGQM
ncbi:MAG: BatA domain-containing protein [Phycisphaerales bacterium JB063]